MCIYIKKNNIKYLNNNIWKRFLKYIYYWFDNPSMLSCLRRMWQQEPSCHLSRIRWLDATSWQNHHCVITGHSSQMTWWQMCWWEDMQRLFAMRALPLQIPSCAGSCICWQLTWILVCVRPLISLWSPYLEDNFVFNIFNSCFYTEPVMRDLSLCWCH